MTATEELLDKAREAANISSDSALSQRLGITRAVISAWRKQLYPIPDERIAQVCALAKLDGPEWLARIHAERAQSPAERALWSKMLTRLAAAAVLLVPFAAMAGTGKSSAFNDLNAVFGAVCILCKKAVRRTRRALGLRRLLRSPAMLGCPSTAWST